MHSGSAIGADGNGIIMSDIPTEMRAERAEGVLHIAWEDRVSRLSLADLRRQCECAQCVNEWTGERILDPDSVADDIVIDKMELVGNYAVRIHWSDGHNSGLFTWSKLREICAS